jgi:hypothetical protein
VCILDEVRWNVKIEHYDTNTDSNDVSLTSVRLDTKKYELAYSDII